jgi:hypothetical protein
MSNQSSDRIVSVNSGHTYHNDQWTTEDQLGRTAYAHAIAKVVEQCKPPLVVGVYGTWGIGKTSLMKLVEGVLAERGENHVRCLWFNAWQHQFDENPVVALSQMLARSAGAERRQQAKKLALMVAAGFGAGVLRTSTGMKLLDLFTIGANYDQEQFLVREERHRLKDHIADLADLVSSQSGNKSRLAIFIDDLDRCMPAQMLAMLEALKLYLDLESCVFLLAIDRAIAEMSIETAYKDIDLNAEEYLEKIVQLPFPVPPIGEERMKQFVSELLPDSLQVCTKMLADGLGPNPRQVKRFVNALTLNDQLAQALDIANYDPRILATLLLIQLRGSNNYRQITESPSLVGALKDDVDSGDLNGALAPGVPLREALKSALAEVDLPVEDEIRKYIHLTRIGGVVTGSKDTAIESDVRARRIDEPSWLEPTGDPSNHRLKNRFVLWVDDRGSRSLGVPIPRKR